MSKPGLQSRDERLRGQFCKHLHLLQRMDSDTLYIPAHHAPDTAESLPRGVIARNGSSNVSG